MQRRQLLLAALATGACAGPRPARAASLPGPACGEVLRFPTASYQADLRNEFSLQLLKLAMEAGRCPVDLRLTGDFTQPAALRAVRDGRLDLAVSTAPLAEPSGLLEVPVPIRRGLLGLRLLVCKTGRAAEISEVSSLEELRRRYRLGHGADWADLPTYQRQGFRVVPAQGYAELFELLHSGHCDILSRGINEVWDEVDSGEHGRGELMAVPGIGLSSVIDDFFVVRADAPALRDALAAGLTLLQRDGRYQALFEQHFKLAIRRSGLQHRRLFALADRRRDPRVASAQAALMRDLQRY